jgi:hypothetical protein
MTHRIHAGCGVQQGQSTSLRGAQRRSNPEKASFVLDCFASLAMTDVSMSLFHHIFFKMRIAGVGNAGH